MDHTRHNLIHAAKDGLRRGWSLLAVRADKRAIGPWKARQTTPATLADLERFSGCCLGIPAVFEVAVAVLRGHRQQCIADGINQCFERAGACLS